MMATLLTPSRSMSVCMAAVKMVAHFRSGKARGRSGDLELWMGVPRWTLAASTSAFPALRARSMR
jgi:hypothetical protein